MLEDLVERLVEVLHQVVVLDPTRDSDRLTNLDRKLLDLPRRFEDVADQRADPRDAVRTLVLLLGEDFSFLGHFFSSLNFTKWSTIICVIVVRRSRE